MKDLNTNSHLFKKRGRGRPRKNATPEILIDDEDDIVEHDLEEHPTEGIKSTLFDEVEEEVDELDESEKDISVPSKKKLDKPDKKEYYVNTERLSALIIQYYEDEIIPDELAQCLYNIAHRISFMPNFINYTWREEMIGDGIIKEFTALKNRKFDPKKGKAFSYFSMIVYNAFCNRIKKENKEKEALARFREESYDCLLVNTAIKTTNQGDDDEDN